MALLDPTLFKVLDSKRIDDVTCVAYKPLGHPMILFSLIDGSPLAALTLRTRHSTGACILVKKPDNELTYLAYDFQGIIDKNNQTFELVITNFCDCMIHFNILKKDVKVNTVDPGPILGLNRVNELYPNQSYVIQCDQEDNRTLVLTSLERTLDVENAHPSGDLMNLYYLSVAPVNTATETIKKFQKTKWDCVDVFIHEEARTFPFDEVDGMWQEDGRNRKVDDAAITSQDIKTSSLARVVGGDYMEEKSSDTGLDYDYSSTSVRCALLLTVNTHLNIVDDPRTNGLLTTTWMEDYVKHKHTRLLDSLNKIYTSDRCCICFLPDPNIIFYQCGHRCVHSDKACSQSIDTCPLCRQFIAAKLELTL